MLTTWFRVVITYGIEIGQGRHRLEARSSRPSVKAALRGERWNLLERVGQGMFKDLLRISRSALNHVEGRQRRVFLLRRFASRIAWRPAWLTQRCRSAGASTSLHARTARRVCLRGRGGARKHPSRSTFVVGIRRKAGRIASIRQARLIDALT
ncbi:hypothetical protein IE81DRAFT_75631 [Ceraceosorus guamensis]|uniref:Uncharacterized protein n=1 Tax=Ceraceosorus guamensis TaxID=1522189 RepID=A0A316W604_9BASI|nr:hypothetical protein IE81DRAFT_75631 [Ceraceosorus guamensis]PWN43463.1 hypothetical protein IE81DRAFT_75631 [Ceraceosorus guamensis]